MKISYNWLLKYIETDLKPQEIADMLTSIGLEVEGLEYYSTLPQGANDLVVGFVVQCMQHPNADKLKLTLVDVGGPEMLNIVCGAPNVEAGQKVIVARDGTTIHPFRGEPFVIKKSKIRGEYSEGMLCAEDEIGLGESHAGLLILDENANIGDPVSSYLKGYSDWIMEIGLTPNRVDAASHTGVARDLAALLGMKVKYPDMHVNISENNVNSLEIVIEDTKACPRYSGLVIKGIEVKDSPEWIQDYLNAIGLKPINNIVDATNFVLHELGHPIHAFDLSKIKGNKIIVKRSVPGSKFTTLDKLERVLDGSELMICNEEGPMALAGIFGGLDSGINAETTDVFIESAYFEPSITRRSARKHQLFTDASFRFERGADPNITLKALGRVAKLIHEIAGGEIIAPVYDVYPESIVPVRLKFDYKYLEDVAGARIPDSNVKSILSDLEFIILEESQTGLLLEIPTFKTDVRRPIDIVEEVIRIYSFDKLPVTGQIRSIIQVDKLNHAEKTRKRISAWLIDRGFFESYLMSFVKEEDNRFFEELPAIPVLNPISLDLAEVRNNLLVPGLKAVLHNLNRQQKDVKFFTWDHIHYKQIGDLKQEYRLNLWLTGDSEQGNWYQKAQKTDIYYLKSQVENIMELAGRTEYESVNFKDRFFSFGVSLVGANDKTFARFGRLDDSFLKKLDISQEVYYADIDARILLKAHGQPLKYDSISKFPKIERDLAMVVENQVSYADIRSLIEKTDNKILKKVSIFDVYKGTNLGEGLKSYAVRMAFEDKTRTLDDKTVDKLMQRIIYRLENDLKVKIRS